MSFDMNLVFHKSSCGSRVAEASSTGIVMTRIAEVSSIRRVLWGWISLRSQGAGGYDSYSKSILTRIAELFSTGRVIWDWASFHLRGADDYL